MSLGYKDHCCDGCGVTCKNQWPLDKEWNMLRLIPLFRPAGEAHVVRQDAYICGECSSRVNEILARFGATDYVR